MNRYYYIEELVNVLKVEKPNLNIYEDYRDGEINYPCLIVIAESEQVSDFSNEHSAVDLELKYIVRKGDENPSAPNEIVSLVCSETTNDQIDSNGNIVVHGVVYNDMSLERKEHTSVYTASLDVHTYRVPQ